MPITVRLVGGPTAILEYGGVRWLTDPALSPPGQYGELVKTRGPAVGADELGPIDAVLLSHDHHFDNLDPGGREFLPRAGRVLTTVDGAGRLGGNAVGLAPWSTVDVESPAGPPVRVTAVPAQHGPDGSEPVMGPVIGFLLSAPDSETLYVSGDNASVDVVRAIATARGPVAFAVLHVGAVQRPEELDGAFLTLSSDRAAEATRLLGARRVVAVHYEGWTHFTQGPAEMRAAFAGNQVLDRLILIDPGETAVLAD
jgi:L-ascorbate metabolism protein UlaG (beta-lactamase superfamily)